MILPLALQTDSWTWQITSILVSAILSQALAEMCSRRRSADTRTTSPDAPVEPPAASERVGPARRSVRLGDIEAERRDRRRRRPRAGPAAAEEDWGPLVVIAVVACCAGGVRLLAPAATQLVLLALATSVATMLLRSGAGLIRRTGDPSWRRFQGTAATAAVLLGLATFGLWWEPFAGGTGEYLDLSRDVEGPRSTLTDAGLWEWLLIGTQGAGVVFVALGLLLLVQTVAGLRLEVHARRGVALGRIASWLLDREHGRAASPYGVVWTALISAVLAAALCSGAAFGAVRALAEPDAAGDIRRPRLILVKADAARDITVGTSERARIRFEVRRAKRTSPPVRVSKRRLSSGKHLVRLLSGLPHGRYVVTATATDAGGNRSRPRRVELRISPRSSDRP